MGWLVEAPKLGRSKLNWAHCRGEGSADKHLRPDAVGHCSTAPSPSDFSPTANRLTAASPHVATKTQAAERHLTWIVVASMSRKTYSMLDGSHKVKCAATCQRFCSATEIELKVKGGMLGEDDHLDAMKAPTQSHDREKCSLGLFSADSCNVRLFFCEETLEKLKKQVSEDRSKASGVGGIRNSQNPGDTLSGTNSASRGMAKHTSLMWH